MRGRGHRRAAVRGLRVAAVVVATAGPGLAGPVAVAGATSGADVEVYEFRATTPRITDHLSPEEVTAVGDVSNVTYTSAPPGGTRSTPSYSGTSAERLADLVGITPYNVRSMDVSVSTAGVQPIALSGTEVRVGSREDPVAPGLPRYALFFAPGGGLTVFRPYRAATMDTQEFKNPDGESLKVRIVTNQGVIDVAVTAPSKAEPGKPIELSARTTGTSSPVDTLTWSFGDGGTADDATTTHRYDVPGTYVARATIETEDGKSGVGRATITVGSPDRAPTDTTPTTDQPGAPGPGGAGGGGTGTPDAPGSGPVTAPGETPGGNPATGGTGPAAPGDQRRQGGQEPDRPRSDQRRRTGAGDDRRRKRSAQDDPVPTTPTTPRSPTPPDPVPPDEGRTTVRSAGRTKDSRRGRSSATRDGSVSGVLVASRAAAIVPASRTEVAAAAAARKGTQPRDPSDLAWILGPLAVVLLLALGAARELRPRRRTRTATRMPAS